MKRVFQLFAVMSVFVSLTVAQKAFVEDEEVDLAAHAIHNRRPTGQADLGIEIDQLPTKQTKASLKERFLGGKIGDGQWRERAELTFWFDQANKLVKVDISNAEENGYAKATGLELEQLFD